MAATREELIQGAQSEALKSYWEDRIGIELDPEAEVYSRPILDEEVIKHFEMVEEQE